MTIFIHHFVDVIFNDRDFFFEFDNINFTIYAYLMNASIQVVLIRNDNFKVVKILRHFRLKYLIEMNYSNVFFVNENIVELIIKISRSSYKFSWFKKIIDLFVIVWIVTIVISSFASFNTTLLIISIMHILSLQLFFIVIFDTSNIFTQIFSQNFQKWTLQRSFSQTFERHFIIRRYDIFFCRREIFFQINRRILFFVKKQRICHFIEKKLNENIV